MKHWTIEEVDDSKVILVDWDDTLWSNVLGVNMGLARTLKAKRAEGWSVVIWTCRTSMLTNTPMSQRSNVERIARDLAHAGVEVDGILLHDKPCVKQYIGDETAHPDCVDELRFYYLGILAPMRVAARKCGYALAVHGSMMRDLDTIALAWVDSPSTPDEVAIAIAESINCGLAVNMVEDEDQHRRTYHIRTPMYRAYDKPSPAGKISEGYIELSVARTANRAEGHSEGGQG